MAMTAQIGILGLIGLVALGLAANAQDPLTQWWYGHIVQIAPLFYLDNTIEEVEGMPPDTPLEPAGRSIDVRQGCYVRHSQMVRVMRDEAERYGHYSLAAESMYDHPYQRISKRTDADLARVGGRYSDEWHVQHMIDRARWCRNRSCRSIPSWRKHPRPSTTWRATWSPMPRSACRTTRR